MRTYDDFFKNVIEFEFKQKPETGDVADPDTYRLMPYEQGKRITNETLKEFVADNKQLFTEVFTYTFAQNTKTFIPPSYICEVKSVMINGVFEMIGDLSNYSSSEIYSPKRNAIYNPTGWVIGDELVMNVIKFPNEIAFATDAEIADTTNFYEGNRTGDQDLIDFPVEWERLLYLTIKKKLKQRQQSNLEQYELAEYATMMMKFKAYSGKVKSKTTINIPGGKFGR